MTKLRTVLAKQFSKASTVLTPVEKNHSFWTNSALPEPAKNGAIALEPKKNSVFLATARNVLLVAVSLACGVLYGEHRQSMKTYGIPFYSVPPGDWHVPSSPASRPVPVSTEVNVAVIRVLGTLRFKFRHVDESNRLIGMSFAADICPDWTPPAGDFKVGTIFNKLIHTEEIGADGTSCWSLNPDKHAGWYKRRDAEEKPILVSEVSRGR